MDSAIIFLYYGMSESLFNLPLKGNIHPISSNFMSNKGWSIWTNNRDSRHDGKSIKRGWLMELHIMQTLLNCNYTTPDYFKLHRSDLSCSASLRPEVNMTMKMPKLLVPIRQNFKKQPFVASNHWELNKIVTLLSVFCIKWALQLHEAALVLFD